MYDQQPHSDFSQLNSNSIYVSDYSPSLDGSFIVNSTFTVTHRGERFERSLSGRRGAGEGNEYLFSFSLNYLFIFVKFRLCPNGREKDIEQSAC